ncbi:MAG: hypothetical protein PHV63_02665 [Candidatus Daviesbacteria bacterium]|nr:hypothetical protein [Candidatus Daviesbacteria bacterium]
MLYTSFHQFLLSAVKNAGGRKVSITHTLIIWTGILLAIFGALVAALGLGGVTTFTFKWKDIIELNSTSVGIIIMIAGAAQFLLYSKKFGSLNP